MQELEVERRVDAETTVPVLNIQKSYEGDAARVEVAPHPTGDGHKESGRAAPAGTEEVRTSLDDPEDLTQWELCLEGNLEQEYADDYEDVDECGYYEIHGR